MRIDRMIKIIIFQQNSKGFMKHATKRTFKNENEDLEFQRAIEELQILRGERQSWE
jgi:hypothetical protein